MASHAAAHLLLTHVDEAKADVTEASQKEGGDKDGDILAVAVSLGFDGYLESVSLLPLTPQSCLHPVASEY